MAPDISAYPAGGGSRPATSQTLRPLTVLGAEGVLSAVAEKQLRKAAVDLSWKHCSSSKQSRQQLSDRTESLFPQQELWEM